MPKDQLCFVSVGDVIRDGQYVFDHFGIVAPEILTHSLDFNLIYKYDISCDKIDLKKSFV